MSGRQEHPQKRIEDAREAVSKLRKKMEDVNTSYLVAKKFSYLITLLIKITASSIRYIPRSLFVEKDQSRHNPKRRRSNKKISKVRIAHVTKGKLK